VVRARCRPWRPRRCGCVTSAKLGQKWLSKRFGKTEAHRKHARADKGTEGAAEELIVDQGRHGGSIGVDGGVLASVVEERINQRATEHQSHTKKLERSLARADRHRRALATVNRAQRRCGRPRGRKAASSETRRSQAPRTGRLVLQGAGEAVTSFAETGRALQRRHELDGVEWRRWKK